MSKNLKDSMCRNATAKKDQRRFIRHPMCFPLEYRIADDKQPADAPKKHIRTKTLNVSRGGVLFPAKKSVDIGTRILIRFPFQDKIFNVRAKVVHCAASPEDKMFLIGVCFERMSDAFKVRLIEQMYLISEYRDIQSVYRGRELSLQEASEEWIKLYSARFRRMYW